MRDIPENPLRDDVPHGTLENCRNALAVLANLDLESLGNDRRACAGYDLLMETIIVTLDDAIQRAKPTELREVGGGAS